MRASQGEIDKFFDSSVWFDIKEMLEADLNQGLNELINPALNEIASLNLTRGKIEIVKEMLSLKEKLTEIKEMEVEAFNNNREEEEQDG